jgi:hypothetical protein
LINLSRNEELFTNLYNVKNNNYYELSTDIKRLLADQYLIPYLGFYDAAHKYCLFYEIDVEIIKLNHYYSTIVSMIDIEGCLNISKLQTDYPCCDRNHLIKKIDDKISEIILGKRRLNIILEKIINEIKNWWSSIYK